MCSLGISIARWSQVEGVARNQNFACASTRPFRALFQREARHGATHTSKSCRQAKTAKNATDSTIGIARRSSSYLSFTSGTSEIMILNWNFGRGRTKWMQWLVLGQAFSVLLVFWFFLSSEKSSAFLGFSSLPSYEHGDSLWPESSSSLSSKDMDKAFLELLTPSDKRLDVFEASVGLTWLQVPQNITSDKASYQGVMGSFCPVNWTRQKREPHTGTFIMNPISRRLLKT